MPAGGQQRLQPPSHVTVFASCAVTVRSAAPAAPALPSHHGRGLWHSTVYNVHWKFVDMNCLFIQHGLIQSNILIYLIILKNILKKNVDILIYWCINIFQPTFNLLSHSTGPPAWYFYPTSTSKWTFPTWSQISYLERNWLNTLPHQTRPANRSSPPPDPACHPTLLATGPGPPTVPACLPCLPACLSSSDTTVFQTLRGAGAVLVLLQISCKSPANAVWQCVYGVQVKLQQRNPL